MALEIKKGDTVIVTTGKDRGKKGVVAQVLSATNKLVIEGLNLKKKHERPRQQGKKGQIVSVASPLQRANVLLWCSNCNRGVRFGQRGTGHTKTRICRRCAKAI